MSYNYFSVQSNESELRKALYPLAAKTPDKLPKHVFSSHDEMCTALRNAVNSVSDYNVDTLNAICKHDRTNFFNWENLSDDEKRKFVTPYTLMAPPFAYSQTIPSPHFVLGQATELELHDNLTLLEIGAGSGYNAVILAESMENNSHIATTEIHPKIVEIAKNNIREAGLENKIDVLHNANLGIGDWRFDRIVTTLAISEKKQIETLLNQLNVGGILRIPIVKIGDTPKKNEAQFWQLGSDIDPSEIYISDKKRNFARVATYKFIKRTPEEIEYSIVTQNALSPLIQG